MDLETWVRVWYWYWYWACSIGVMFYFNINFTVHSVDIVVVALFSVADTIDTINGVERGREYGGESSLCYMYDP